MKRAIMTWLLVAAGLTGCATNWQSTSITNPQLADRQFRLDDGYCTQVADGSALMPPMPAPAITAASTTTGQVAVRNMTTGQTLTGNYTETTIPSPAASFTSGFNNGMALGAVIAARKSQERIHDGCMLRKGWAEAPRGVPHAAPASAAVARAKAGDTESNVSSALLCHIVLNGNGRDLGDIPVDIENGQIWSGIDPVWGPVDISDKKFRWVYDLGSRKKQYAGLGILAGGQIERDTGEYHEYMSHGGTVTEISHGVCRIAGSR